MIQGRIKKLYIKRLTESLQNTPKEATTLVKCLEEITNIKYIEKN